MSIFLGDFSTPLNTTGEVNINIFEEKNENTRLGVPRSGDGPRDRVSPGTSWQSQSSRANVNEGIPQVYSSEAVCHARRSKVKQ